MTVTEKIKTSTDSRYLFQPPCFKGGQGNWHLTIEDALENYAGPLTWDITAVSSCLDLNYVSGDRTLFQEIKRNPWLSQTGDGGKIELEQVPRHGRKVMSSPDIALRLSELLIKEAAAVCSGRKQVYILLSGGLDSRIVAAVASKLYQDGVITERPIGLTWGLPDSRDVVYGRKTAEILNIDWQHIPMGPDDLIYNVEQMSSLMGAMVPPMHLHCMHWFKDISPDSLVLAGSYGDSVGRAEFSGRHILELGPLRLFNRFGLIPDAVFQKAQRIFEEDIQELHTRISDSDIFAFREVERQAIYMRNMIAQVMSVINRYCELYQMFTHPDLFSFIWDIHPGCRTNEVYACLLEHLNPQVARLPWARTGRALRGDTIKMPAAARSDYHDYEKWIAGPAYEKFKDKAEPEWFAQTGLFRESCVRKLTEDVTRIPVGRSRWGIVGAEKWLWLVTIRLMAERVGRPIEPAGPIDDGGVKLEHSRVDTMVALMRRVAKTPAIMALRNRRKITKKNRIYKNSFKLYPPCE